MTPERAIDVLRSLMGWSCTKYSLEERIEAFDVANKALERQIPKKPENGNMCPVCCTEVKYYYVGEDAIDDDLPILVKDIFCTNCGQKIDWSKDDD